MTPYGVMRLSASICHLALFSAIMDHFSATKRWHLLGASIESLLSGGYDQSHVSAQDG